MGSSGNSNIAAPMMQHYYSAIRRRKFQKACYDTTITILCGFMTFQALRSCIEGGKLRTPIDDLHDIQRVSQVLAYHVSNGRKHLLTRADVTASSNKSSSPNHGVLVVTGTHQCAGSELLLMALKNKLDYCRIHGLEMMYDIIDDGTLTASASSAISLKLSVIKDVMLSHTTATWVWWVDGNALFTNMATALPMNKYERAGYNVVILQGQQEESADSWSLLVRNSPWSIQFLSEWLGQMSRSGNSAAFLSESGDVAALQMHIGKSAEWGSNVYVETFSNVQVSWRDNRKAKDKAHRTHDGKGLQRNTKQTNPKKPLMMHFAECNVCGRSQHPEYDDDCSIPMKAALQAANKEALELQGFGRHQQQNASSRAHNRF